MSKLPDPYLKQRLLLASVFAVFATSAFASDAEDPQSRIHALEKQMQQMAEQLRVMQEQLARATQSSTPVSSAAPSKAATGSPVEASFKNGLVLRDATGDWALRLYARAQLDYRHFSPDASAADTFSMRRARLGAIATFYEDFTLRVEGEYSGDGKYNEVGKDTGSYARMNDGYLDYTHFKPAMIRVGQFKTMYGLERSQGAMDLNFMERAMTESLLGSVFDRGIMVHGAPIAGAYYNLAYVNGTGQNIDESNARSDSKDWSLRAVGNIAQWAGWQDSVVHLGGFYANGKQATTAIPKLRTEGRGVEFFKVTDPTGGSDRTLKGIESSLAYGPVKYQGEYIRTNFDEHGFSRDMSAWYTSVQWLVTGEHYADMYKNGAFGGITPKANFRYGNNAGWGALELGARYTHFDASDFKAALANTATASYTDGADAWTLGAKWVECTVAVKLCANSL